MEVTKEKYKKVKPPFGYFGSKGRIALQICNDLPMHNCWVDVFCGSSAVTLAKPKAPIEVINDLNCDIINLFKQLRDNHEELKRVIYLTPYSSDELLIARIPNPLDSDLERARKFLVQSMMAINGVFGIEKGGFSYSNSYTRNNNEARVNRWNNLPERLDKVVERLKGVRVENKNAIDLMKKFEKRPATLMYLDPPYLGDRTSGYDLDANNEAFHIKLLKNANKSRAMIFISGYENDIYDSMLTEKKGWSKRTIETATTDSKGNNHSRVEVLWMNKYFTQVLEKKSLRIRLTKEEIKNNKLNPIRKR